MAGQESTDVARVLAALYEAKAWFRHGISDGRLAELTGLPMVRAVGARVRAEAEGLVERQGVGTKDCVTLLTPAGVAKAQAAASGEQAPSG